MKRSLKGRAGRHRKVTEGRATPRPAFREGWVPFVMHLWTDVALFSAVAFAVVLAVLSQDPGAQAASAPPPDSSVAARRMLFAQVRQTPPARGPRTISRVRHSVDDGIHTPLLWAEHGPAIGR